MDARFDKEHAQRLTLQHHAADQAQRIALLDALLRAMQADAVEYLRPDGGRDAAWLVGRLLRHLDGPEQRAAQGDAS